MPSEQSPKAFGLFRRGPHQFVAIAVFWGNAAGNTKPVKRSANALVVPVLAWLGRITPIAQLPHCRLSERNECATALPHNSALAFKSGNSDHPSSIGSATAPNLSVNPVVVFGIIRNLQCLCSIGCDSRPCWPCCASWDAGMGAEQKVLLDLLSLLIIISISLRWQREDQ